MPTDNPRVSFALSPEQLSALEAYQFDHRVKNRTQAILALIEKGLASIQEEIQKTPLYSSGALGLARQYDGLDGYGKRMLEVVAAQEEERCRGQGGPAPAAYVEAAARDGSLRQAPADPSLKLPPADTPIEPQE